MPQELAACGGPNEPLPACLPKPGHLRNVFIAAAIGTAAALLPGCGAVQSITRDDASYNAGQATGVDWARQTMTSRGGSVAGQVILGDRGPGPVSDAEIVGTCPEIAHTAENTQTYYYPGGQIMGRDIHDSDFIKGCLDGARSVVGGKK